MVLFGCGVHGLGEVAHVAGGDAGDGDSAVLGEVDAVVPGAGRHLIMMIMIIMMMMMMMAATCSGDIPVKANIPI